MELSVRIGDILHAGLPLPEMARQLARRFEESEWLKNTPAWEPVHELTHELFRADSEQEMVLVLAAIYDQAAYARCAIYDQLA